jgi:hypothetical protein
MTYALINADPNVSYLGEIVSTHRTLKGAGKAFLKMGNARFAYVAKKRADGTYPHRVEALDLADHAAAIDAANAS